MNYFVCLDIYILTKNKLINLFIYSMLIHRDTVVKGVINYIHFHTSSSSGACVHDALFPTSSF